MHKARENANGTFSIGKTWNLDDLNAIQSFTNTMPATPDEQANKQRAGAVGFIVTITKPYYWQASTAKEKEFFIFSLIKIFKKYTAGRIPDLIGFDPQEMETFSSATGPPPTTQRAPRPESPRQESESSARSISASQPPPSQSQYSSRQPSEQQAQPYPSPMGLQVERIPPSRSENRPPPRSEDRPRSSQERFRQGRPSFDHPLQERPLKTTDSEERIAQIPGSFPSSDFVRNLKPQTSQTQLRNKKSDSPALQYEQSENRDLRLDRSATGTTDPLQNGPQYRMLHSARTNDDRVRQTENHIYGPQQATPQRANQTPMPVTVGPPSSRPSQESLQERGRPSAADPKASFSVPRSLGTESSTEGSRPPTSDGRRREISKEQWHAVPDPSKDSLQPPSFQRAPSSEISNYEESRPSTASRTAIPDITPPPVAVENIETDVDAAPPSPSAIPTPLETPTELHRPGLGPMIKTKKSNKEIASTIRKAATAYNAFKPRAGGAADRLREQQTSPTGEPDGITGVVPAPSLLKGASQGVGGQSRSQTPDLKTPQQPYQQGAVPTLRVDSPSLKPPSPVQIQQFDQQPPSPFVPPDTPAEAPTPPEKPAEEQRRQHKSDHSLQYANVLALDPQILVGRTLDFETSLNDFGWGEEPSKRCTFEDLQVNVRKEVARAEAGGWLNAIKQNDDRIAALGSMMDRVIGECEELDGLLTLYGVELSVGFPP